MSARLGPAGSLVLALSLSAFAETAVFYYQFLKPPFSRCLCSTRTVSCSTPATSRWGVSTVTQELEDWLPRRDSFLSRKPSAVALSRFAVRSLPEVPDGTSNPGLKEGVEH